jgi:hypothetical protein
MPFSLLRARLWLMIGVSLLVLPGLLVAADAKPVLLYSRYFNAQGEKRYLADGTYSEILKLLGSRFVVRTHAEPLRASTLAEVAVVLIANPSDQAVGANPPPPHCSADDVAALTAYVHGGGGLIVMGNQENHNYETKDMNVLLAQFGMQFVDTYTDAKQLVIPAAAPIIGGTKWAYYTGNQITLQSGHAANPQALVPNDLTQMVLGGTRDAAGVLLATATPGSGRVVLVTDSGWISNDALSGKGIGKVAITEHDNAEIFTRICRWCANGQ